MKEIIRIVESIAKAISPYHEIIEFRGQYTLVVPVERIVDLMIELRDNPETSFDMLIDITAIDWLDRKKNRFEVVYFLYSNKHKARLRVKVPLHGNENPTCPSMVEVYESA
ncbi:MAG: NADH-quinone oxidoreductase subunit C, partial [Candidatus Kapaibacteriota bacterium]